MKSANNNRWISNSLDLTRTITFGMHLSW